MVAGVVLVVFGVGVWLTSGEFESGWLRFFSVAVLAATGVLALWDYWLWRLPLVQRMPGVPRNLRGTWQGTLTSFWVDPATGASPAPKTVFLVVQQTASAVTVKLLTDESRSTSVLSAVTAADGGWTLAYLFVNRPGLQVEHRSRMHHGSTVLDVAGTPVTRLQGRYWTDRDSKGELEFTRRHPRLADDFVAASGYFS